MPVPGRHLILETTFETAQGSAMLIDFMLIPKREDRVDLVHGAKRGSSRIVYSSSGALASFRSAVR